MINYYNVLEVDRNAKAEDIKRSYRRLAMKYHPDRNGHRTKWAEAKFRTIVKAYDTLIDQMERASYDKRLEAELEAEEDPFRARLKSKPDDPHSQARLVLHFLLNENGRAAVETYERMKEGVGEFDLARYLDNRDYLDAEFLLGEEYERRGEWSTALGFYENVYREEQNCPMRYFLEEVKDRIRDIYCKRLARRSPPAEAIKIYNKVLSMGFPKKTEAYLHKKIAESYFKMAEIRSAKEHLGKAFRLEPKLKGAQKICEKLDMRLT
jgi:curved DNA-binding protein CbpA